MAPKAKDLAAMVGDLTDLVRSQQAMIERLAGGRGRALPSITVAELFAKYSIVRQQASNWGQIPEGKVA